MAPDDRKLRKDYGMLCGTRREQSSSSSSTVTRPDRDDSAMILDSSERNNRPQSLTLPFENRERESHLVSEEEFDRIARDAQANNPLPTIPSRFRSEFSEGALRRSISTAPRSRYSFLPGPPRPLSEDIGAQLERTGAAHLPRDLSSLTALPRVPTQSFFFDSAEITIDPRGRSSGYNRALHAENDEDQQMTDHEERTGHGFMPGTGSSQHKRRFSMTFQSGGVFDAMRKRFKRSDTTTQDENANAVSTSQEGLLSQFSRQNTTSAAEPAYRRHSSFFPASPDVAMSNTGIISPLTSIANADIVRESKPSFLRRAFSRRHKKSAHKARPTISVPVPIEEPPASQRQEAGRTSELKDQELRRNLIRAFQGELDRRNAAHEAALQREREEEEEEEEEEEVAALTAAVAAARVASSSSSAASSYSTERAQTPLPAVASALAPFPAASAVPMGPVEPHPSSPPAEERGAAAAAVLRAVFPPTRAQLTREVARQQSRIQDLNALNTTLMGQVEALNTQLGVLRMQQRGAVMASPREQALGGRDVVVGVGGVVGGVFGGVADEEGEAERRRTWMTVEEEDEDEEEE